MERGRTRHLLARIGVHRPQRDRQWAVRPDPRDLRTTWKVQVERLYNCDTTVIMQGRYRGTVQSTGRDLASQVVHIWDLEGNKIVRFQQYTDTWLFAEATGVAPETT